VTEVSPAELQELLASATAPVPAPKLKLVLRISLVHEFLREHRIEPGPAYSVETAVLYQMYLAWAARAEGETRVVHPVWFARGLNSRGIKRRRPAGARASGGRDHRVLMVKGEAAQRLLAWARENPLTPDQRRIFIRKTP
jgi:hypothetical protein